jgi:hypothetical protein
MHLSKKNFKIDITQKCGSDNGQSRTREHGLASQVYSAARTEFLQNMSHRVHSIKPLFVNNSAGYINRFRSCLHMSRVFCLLNATGWLLPAESNATTVNRPTPTTPLSWKSDDWRYWCSRFRCDDITHKVTENTPNCQTRSPEAKETRKRM